MIDATQEHRVVVVGCARVALRVACVFAVVAAALTGACGAPADEAPATALPIDGYIWRRSWTPALREVASSPPAEVDRLRVLVVEDEPQQGSGRRAVTVPVDAAALARSGRPVVAVWRISGTDSLDRADPALLLEAVRGMREAGARVVGVEVDYDCPTAALSGYVAWLRGLRSSLGAVQPPPLLGVTALPTWRENPQALRALAKGTDEVTVQVHAIAAPALFDPDRAGRVATAFSETAGAPVSIALPTYSAQIKDGVRLGVREEDVARVVRELRAVSPARRAVTRIAFFRLGAADDVSVFSAPALAAVARGEAPAGAFVVEAEAASDGAVTIAVRGTGTAATPLPAAIDVGTHVVGRLEAGDGFAGYRFDAASRTFIFSHPGPPPRVRPGDVVRVGWVRPESP